MKRALAVIAIFTATSALAQVVPTYDCWTDTGTTITLRLGYINTSTSTVDIPAGASNYFTPGPASRGQVTSFQPGNHPDAMLITLTDEEAALGLEWRLQNEILVFDFSPGAACSGCFCPAGPAGPEGPQGPQGPIGAQGAAGLQGPAGTQGPAGPAGAMGPAGAEGPAGPPGPAGLQGPPGVEGPKGEMGAAGPAGPQGIAGMVGEPGPVGPTGAEGPKGETGDRGAEGPAGPAGARGPEGAAGPRGETGLRGAPGRQGARGERGRSPILAAIPIRSSASKGPVTVETSERSTLVIFGSVVARGGGAVEILIDDRVAGAPMTLAGTEVATIPLSAQRQVGSGTHVISLRGVGGAEIVDASLSVLVTGEVRERRRAVAR